MAVQNPQTRNALLTAAKNLLPMISDDDALCVVAALRRMAHARHSDTPCDHEKVVATGMFLCGPAAVYVAGVLEKKRGGPRVTRTRLRAEGVGVVESISVAVTPVTRAAFENWRRNEEKRHTSALAAHLSEAERERLERDLTIQKQRTMAVLSHSISTHYGFMMSNAVEHAVDFVREHDFNVSGDPDAAAGLKAAGEHLGIDVSRWVAPKVEAAPKQLELTTVS